MNAVLSNGGAEDNQNLPPDPPSNRGIPAAVPRPQLTMP